MDYERWCALSDEQLATHDVAYLNLLAAEGLPGSESLDIDTALRKVDRWAEIVYLNTIHWRKTYVPRSYCPTESHFCMQALVTVLQRDMGVHYCHDCMTGPYSALDAKNNFLNGPLCDHGGTCCSLPILYLAVGRRLGYPLKLVPTKGHSFVRWDDPHGERFNVECACIGFSVEDDEHYRQWPRVYSEADRANPYWLSNLTPRQELAHHICERAHCLMDNLEFFEAVKAYYFANRVDSQYELFWAAASTMERIVERMRCFSPSIYAPVRRQLETAVRSFGDPRELPLLREAQQDLERILGLHESRSGSSWNQILNAGGLNHLTPRPHISLVKEPSHVRTHHRSLY